MTTRRQVLLGTAAALVAPLLPKLLPASRKEFMVMNLHGLQPRDFVEIVGLGPLNGIYWVRRTDEKYAYLRGPCKFYQGEPIK